MKVLIKVQLSPHKYKTPEGYLICEDSVLARTGKQQYMKCELYEDCEGDQTIIDLLGIDSDWCKQCRKIWKKLQHRRLKRS